jgi:hypothetical protein
MKRFALAITLALTAFGPCIAAPTRVAAQAKPAVDIRPISVSWSHGVPRLTTSGRHLADARVLKKLKSGLPQTLVLRVYAYPDSGKEPIAVAAQSCRVTYDLWEDVFRVQLQTEARDSALSLPSVEAVVSRCLELRELPIGTADVYRAQLGKPIYFAAIVELNPLSPDTVQRIRRWLARPGSGQIAGDAFFGSFVSIFVNRRIGTAERTVSFRCPSLHVPP